MIYLQQIKHEIPEKKIESKTKKSLQQENLLSI